MMCILFVLYLCIMSVVVPSKSDLYINICVAVTAYVFGCSSVFSKIYRANMSSTVTVFLSVVI